MSELLKAYHAQKPVPPKWPNGKPGKVPLVFVAEAPSDEEVIKREPLVGPSGRVFNAILRTAGIERDGVLLTNVFDRQAPNNDVRPWQADAQVRAEAFARLAAELDQAGSNVVVALGNTALWAFAETSALTPFRGSVLTAKRIRAGQKVVPTLHPRAVMEQWKFLPVVVQDLTRALAEAAYPERRFPKVSVYVEPNLSEALEWLDRMAHEPLVSVDIETGWGQITSIAFGTADEAMSIPFVDLRRPDRSYWRNPDDEFQVWRAVGRVLRDPAVRKLGQNFVYDAFWLWHWAGLPIYGYDEDTRLLHHALYPELPKDLAFMSGYSDLGAWKQLGSKWSKDKRDA